jgi:metal-dependent amidase/aminoacylase/carboxypeptidase family protein
MFMLGAGKDIPALHRPDYDFPDTLIETGIKIFDTIVRKVLG